MFILRVVISLIGFYRLRCILKLCRLCIVHATCLLKRFRQLCGLLFPQSVCVIDQNLQTTYKYFFLVVFMSVLDVRNELLSMNYVVFILCAQLTLHNCSCCHLEAEFVTNSGGCSLLMYIFVEVFTSKH